MQLEDRDEVLNAIPSILSNAFCDPRYTTDLMFFELEVAVEHGVLELLEEGLLVEVDFMRDKAVFQLCRDAVLSSVRVARCLEEGPVLGDGITRLANLFQLVRTCKGVVALRIEASNCGEESCALLLGELGVEGVDCHAERAAVSFECEDAVHDLCGRPANLCSAEFVEVFEVCFVESVTDDLDVEVVEVGCGDAFSEVRGYEW